MSFCDLEVDQQDDLDVDILENYCDRRELERIVKIYIINYFSEKGVKDFENLISPKYIDLCLDTDICSGVDRAYEAIEKSGKFETLSSEHSISEDIRFVIKTLGQIKNFVPQEFSAGLLLMHLEFIEGISLS